MSEVVSDPSIGIGLVIFFVVVLSFMFLIALAGGDDRNSPF